MLRMRQREGDAVLEAVRFQLRSCAMLRNRSHRFFYTLTLAMTLCFASVIARAVESSMAESNAVENTSASTEVRCATPAASLQSANGKVDWRRSNNHLWQKAHIGQSFCTGDSIRVESQRAALRLANNTLVRLKEKTLITLLPEDTSFWLELKEGAAHFLTRTPKAFTVKAPYLNAAVDGTEFVVSASASQNEVVVFEGQVTTSNALGKVILNDGMRAFCEEHTAPQIGTKIRLQDSAEWVLYYPPLFIDAPVDGPIQILIDRQQYTQALDALGTITLPNANTLALMASLALTIGQNSEAKTLINKALMYESENANAGALNVLLLLVDGDAEQALTQSQNLIHNHPAKLSVQLAHSYALQAQGEIEKALAIVKHAYTQSPESTYIIGRYAELSLSAGKTRQTKKLLAKTLTAHPSNSRLNTLAGFVELNQLASQQALTYFNQAIAYNSEDSLSYLGKALALIQQGKLEQGREQMELAVLLDPSSSLLRSYLGKTYFEGERNDWSETQYQLAKILDPNDPTPWYYEAHLKLKQNRPIEALKLITTAIEKNDNRAVYRSRFLLDSDAAARSANQAGIYQALGFSELAKNTAAMAVSDNPTDFAAHQALTLAYSDDPKAHRVRADEALMTKILQPIGSKALPVGMGTIGVQSLPWLSPSKLGHNEYSSLFAKRGLSGHVSTFAGTQDSVGYDWQTQAIGKNVSFDMGQYKYDSEGFRDNNNLNEEITEIGFHHQLTDRFKYFLQHSEREQESGDLTHGIESEQFNESLKNEKEWKTNELGVKFHIDSKSQLLAHINKTTLESKTNYLRSGEFDVTNTDNIEYNQYELIASRESNILRLEAGYQHLSSEENFITSSEQYPQSYSHKKVYLKLQSLDYNGLSFSFQPSHIDQVKTISENKLSNSNNEFILGALWEPTSNHLISLSRWKSISVENPYSADITNNHIYQTAQKQSIGYFNENYYTVLDATWKNSAAMVTLTATHATLEDLKYNTTVLNFRSPSTLSLNEIRVSSSLILNRLNTLKLQIDNSRSNSTKLSQEGPTRTSWRNCQITFTRQLSSFLSFSTSAYSITQKNRYEQLEVDEAIKTFLINASIDLNVFNNRGQIEFNAYNLFDKKTSLYQGQLEDRNNLSISSKEPYPYSRSASITLSYTL